MNVSLTEISPASSEARQLFKLLDEHNLSHCPPEVCNLLQPEEMEAIESILFGVFCHGVLSAIGGLKFHPDYAEVTRMYVKEEHRGQGFARCLLERLKQEAVSRNISVLKLETSENFKSAMNLYTRHGFELCAPFGEYVDRPWNTYMHWRDGS
ncbi:MAG: hypothetical protein CME36_12865 [unclassified Hahellaceae]|nr:hypothetical protein [Hahellaceae bacterium]|tara:strand:+ start:74811 stop:75269 length:459 start_codon:yes stop_codon:yes gene_type:complete